MLSRRVAAIMNDELNESEEWDQESRIFRIRESEFDVANLFNRHCSEIMFDIPNRSVRSVSVQTDPDTSVIPPSWLLAGEMLVDELYTGLGNIINTMYHNPQSCSKQDAMRKANLNPAAMKYFTFNNGYWQSTLLPSIKIRDLVGTDEENRALCSEDTKRRLKHLLEVASKLRNLVPYIGGCEPCGDEVADDEMQSYFSSSLKGEASGELRDQSPLDVKIDAMDDTLVADSSDSGESSACSPEYCGVQNPMSKRLRKDSDQEIASKKKVALYDACRPDEITGVEVLRYTPAPRDCTSAQKSKLDQKLRKDVNAEKIGSTFCSRKTFMVTAPPKCKVLASCSNKLPNKAHQYDCTGDSTGKERTLYGPKVYLSKSRGNCGKNFIRKNIMDVKTKRL